MPMRVSIILKSNLGTMEEGCGQMYPAEIAPEKGRSVSTVENQGTSPGTEGRKRITAPSARTKHTTLNSVGLMIKARGSQGKRNEEDKDKREV